MARADRAVDLTAPWRALVQVFLVALILSGVVLALGYDADPDAARGSVAALPGALRALHHWAGVLTMAAAAGFAGRAWLRGAERERAYPGWAGVVGAVVGAAFIYLGGRMLAWDDVGWGLYRRFAWWAPPGADTGAMAPAGAPLLVLVIVHLVVGLVGAAVLVLVWRRHDGRAWSAFLHRAMVMPWAQRLARRVAGAFAALLVVLAVFVPPRLGPPASAGALAPPPWPFAWTVPFEQLLGIGGFWLAFLGGSALVALLPVVGGASLRLRIVAGSCLVLSWLGLGVAGVVLADRI